MPISKDIAEDILRTGRDVIRSESDAMLALEASIGASFVQAVEILHKLGENKVVLTGMGKSGLIAQKIAATFSSIGTPAIFLHPAEALHGDLGVYQAGDPTVLLSKSGSTAELMRLIPTLRQFNSPIIAILGKADSPIGRLADVVIEAGVMKEADPLGIVPTSSALLSLAVGDALASALMRVNDFQEGDFAKLHPGGQLGRNLLLRVEDVMHGRDRVATVTKEARGMEVIEAITESGLGAACVVEGETVIGIITDGDVRRLVLREERVTQLVAENMMNASPTVVKSTELLADALKLMEDRESPIGVLPVVGENQILQGMIRIHDIYKPE